MRKIIVLFIIIVIVFTSTACTSGQTITHHKLEAKTDYYEDLDALIEMTSLIIVGEKVDENESKLFEDLEGNVITGYTLSGMAIKRIIKNETGIDLDKKSIIQIIENEYFNPETNEVFHIEGYKKMKTNGVYLMFLDYSETDGWYVPKAVTFGKVPLDDNEDYFYGDGYEHQKELLTQAKKLYKLDSK